MNLDDLMSMAKNLVITGITLEDAITARQSLDDEWPARSESCGELPLVPKNKRQKIKVFREGCYICCDPEFRAYGLPLCYPCPKCGGHIAADDTICDDCGYEVATGPGEGPGQGIKCPECGSWTWSGVEHCRNCGAKVNNLERTLDDNK